jgi:polyvinyl alcohol dehydrogenase (cytochrome)
MRRTLLALVVAGALLALCSARLARSQEQTPLSQLPPIRKPMGTEEGFALFQTRCMACHGNPNANPKATELAAIRAMTPEKIYGSLVDGKMKTEGQSLSDDEKRRLAEFMGSRTLGSSVPGNGKNMPNQCPSNPPIRDPAAEAGWSGWGADIANTRYQPAKAAGLTTDQLPQLKLKWAFGFPTGLSANAQPAVAAGRVFIGSDIGYIYSLDAASGCIYWSTETGIATRNAMTIGPVTGHGATKYAVFFGDAQANVYALDAQNGALLWKKKVDDFFVARNTASPTFYDGRLYVPVSSSEEYTGGVRDYQCCTSRGSVLALDANTGEQVWKTYVLPPAEPTRKNSKGTQLWAPAGGSIWNSPTVDPVRRAVYVGTGDAETEPTPKTTDAVMAVDMDSGKILWVYQATENDSFMGGCSPVKTENCPEVQGPDADIGNSPILRTLPGGERVVVAATKGGDIFGLDPDKNGALLWRVNASGNPRSGVLFGGTADEQNAYYGFTGGGVAAVSLATGEKKWFAPIAPAGANVAHSAAATMIPGIVFQGGQDGKLTALSAADGHIVWQVDTAKDYETVNKVAAHGGSMRAPGAVVAGGMLFVGSGYAVSGVDKPGNVILAFSSK